MPDRCADCHAQVDHRDWFQHRSWHADQADALGDLQDSVERAEENSKRDRKDIEDLRKAIEDALRDTDRLKG